jgi:predicted PurR-regulated permease PerM
MTAPSDPGSEPAFTIELSRRSIWQVIFAVLLVLIAVWVFFQARHLIGLLAISVFFALALEPAVTYLHRKRGWKRGAAVGVIYLAGFVAIFVLVLFLIPATVSVGQTIGDKLDGWLASVTKWVNDTFGRDINLSLAGDSASAGAEAAADWSSKPFGTLLGIASTGAGLLFSAATIAMFTFYFAADSPRVRMTLLSMLPPERQERLGWVWDQAIIQTGGYFYSRLLLMIINGFGFFFTMIVVGLPVAISIPLAIFAGFVSEFIPAVGTYIGAAVPVLVALAFEGWVAAFIVVGYAVIYQQIENYYLSPRISSKTMEINGAVAFGSALAGGAIAGPMGAFVALPVAALITAFASNYRHHYPIVYESRYDDHVGTDDQDADEGSDAD